MGGRGKNEIKGGRCRAVKLGKMRGNTVIRAEIGFCGSHYSDMGGPLHGKTLGYRLKVCGKNIMDVPYFDSTVMQLKNEKTNPYIMIQMLREKRDYINTNFNRMKHLTN